VHTCFIDQFVGREHGLDLCEFDAEPVYLDLVVHASYEHIVTFPPLVTQIEVQRRLLLLSTCDHHSHLSPPSEPLLSILLISLT
jgi:hypothetical protein